MLEPAPNPATLPAPASYHWTPALQADFLGHLAALASVSGAALFVQMSTRAAYNLRNRRDGVAFKLGWAAAIIIARDRLQDQMLDRAMHGAEDVHRRRVMGAPGEWEIRRCRINGPASMAMLDRLDRQIADRAATREDRLARIIAADFATYLDLFTTDAFAADPDAALAGWFAEQRARPDPLIALFAPPPKPREVAQISADSEPEQSPEEAAADLEVWYDEDYEEWRTNFPPADDGFDGNEEGEFGADDYERSLDDAEFAVMQAADQASKAEWMVPFHAAAEARRAAYFAEVKAYPSSPCTGEGSETCSGLVQA